MANPTTYFGWVMPTATDLVTDLPADFNVFGQGVDTSMQDLLGGTTGQVLSKTSNTNMDFTWVTPTDQTPLTTKGDLFTFTTVDARLGIGTNDQVLTADSAQATGMKWATPVPGGGMTLISRTSFSNVASQAFDGVFTSTYETYFVTIDDMRAATASDDLQWQFRYAGPTTQTSAYYAANFGYTYANALVTSGSDNASELTLATQTGASDRLNSAQLYVNQVGNASEYGAVSGLVFNNPGLSQNVIGGIAFVARTYTGFLLKSASTNITGTVSIFGVNKS
jgi:hypothetical protein